METPNVSGSKNNTLCAGDFRFALSATRRPPKPAILFNERPTLARYEEGCHDTINISSYFEVCSLVCKGRATSTSSSTIERLGRGGKGQRRIQETGDRAGRWSWFQNRRFRQRKVGGGEGCYRRTTPSLFS